MLREFIKTRVIRRARFQDVLFIIGIFVFSAILVLGLFPRTDTGVGAGRVFFLYSMMTIPAIVAIYFIAISFRRKLYSGVPEVGSSIRLKIALAFVFVAILPSLPIILISNNLINNTISELLAEKTAEALAESIHMSHDAIVQLYDDMEGELKTLDYSLRNGFYDIGSLRDRSFLSHVLRLKGFSPLYYTHRAEGGGRIGLFSEVDLAAADDFSTGIKKLLGAVDITEGFNIYHITIKGSPLLVGRQFYGGYIVALYREMPKKILGRMSLFTDSLRRYRQSEFLKPYFQTGMGIFLLLLSIFIILLSIAVSIFLSKSISKPVLELVDAAKMVASGNFNVHLSRTTSDELTLLFNSFNKMAKQLDDGRRLMFHAQKLEARREMARKLMHELKNPLTPIRLSAERMQRRFKEGHPDIGNIVLMGTETIIEEVNVLTKILNEFTKFARLPEARPENQPLNPVLENCVKFFHGHEGVIFKVDLDARVGQVCFDKTLIRQAMINIIQNSIDAVGGNGQISIKTESSLDEGVETVKIRIRDDGSGISHDNLEKIFEPTFSTKAHGTGLGLTIVEKIVLDHRGKISCDSEPGRGTEFIIEIPVKGNV